MKKIRFTALIHCIALLLGMCGSALAQTSSLEIDDVRPVEAALNKLETIYGIPATYEERAFTSDADARWAVNDDGSPKQKGEGFTFSYVEPAKNSSPESRKGLMQSAIRDVLQKYNQSEHAHSAFTFVEADNGFHVFPAKFKDGSGLFVNDHPFLDTPIRLPEKQRTGYELVRDMLKAISETSKARVGLGTISGAGWALQPQTPIAVTSPTPARQVLEQLLRTAPAPLGKTTPGTQDSLSWSLMCPADSSKYPCALNIHVVKPFNP